MDLNGGSPNRIYSFHGAFQNVILEYLSPSEGRSSYMMGATKLSGTLGLFNLRCLIRKLYCRQIKLCRAGGANVTFYLHSSSFFPLLYCLLPGYSLRHMSLDPLPVFHRSGGLAEHH